MSQTLVSGVTVTVEAALSAATATYGAWDTALWDAASWGPDVVWTDITDYVRSVNTDRRFDRAAQLWESGTATLVLDNRDARFSPANLAGPYVTAGVTGVRPWRPVRIRATWAGVTYDLYRGYVTAWQESYVDPMVNAGDAIVTVPCVDEFGALARFDGLAGGTVGAGETTGQRMHRVLNAAGHTGARNIDLGNTTVQATTLGMNAVAELNLTSDSEGESAAVYVDRSGTVTFERSTALIENSRSNTLQATFSDAAGQLGYKDLALAYDGDLLVNIASFARVGGATQTATNETSRALYGDKRATRSDLICTDDAHVAQLASFHISKYGTPDYRITAITVKPRFDPTNLWPQVLGREVRDLVRVVRQPPGGITITRDCHIVGISHAFDQADWTTTFSLWSAAVYQGVGRWDVGTWDSSTWFF